jgi:hypothetical protein
LVAGIGFLWVGAGFLYIAVDKNVVADAFSARSSSGHNYLFPLYKGLMATFQGGTK